MIPKPLFALRLFLLGLAITLFAVFVRAPLGATAMPSGEASENRLWQDINEATLTGLTERWIVPQHYRTLLLNEPALMDVLNQAPAENAQEASTSPREIVLPLPDGSYQRFHVVKVSILAAELAARYPTITTYRAVGVDDPSALAILDHTPAGFHAMILSGGGTVFIDPYRKADTLHYISYFRSDFLSPVGKTFVGRPPLGDAEKIRSLVAQMGPQAVSGETLRTYRTAIAATGEYTAFHGGTVANGLAAVVVSLNRVSGIYEREVAIRMVLIANNDLIIYTNPATDPYTNNDGVAMLGQNQTTIDSVIGASNYDIGHVFSTGGGGVAYLGVPCENGWKAQGVTGSSRPVGDPYDVDYVAHEMGHQFGANHTFNSTVGSCGGGNRNAATAYEPGSASTIMGYAGICGTADLQPHSDDDFHTVSFDEIVAYTTLGNGDTCAVKTSTGNHPPTVEAGSGGFTIPKGTPFTLAGSGSDPDGHSLTFSWEEFDLGPAGSPNSPSGNAPIFRSFSPVNSPSRTFPKMSDIVNNTHTIGELLPTYARNLTFRLTARDNYTQPSAGGVAYDTIAFAVSGSAGPFLVTAPNTAVTWVRGEIREVTWDVANTQAAPVNCASVDIALSIDGGYTYPISLTTATQNDGSAIISVPNITTTQARVRISCATSIFFDISNANFTVQPATNPPASFEKASPLNASVGIPLTTTLSWHASSGASRYEYCLDTSDNDVCDTAWISTTAEISSATAISVSGLTPDTLYSWQVRASNSISTTYANDNAWWHFTTRALPAAFGKTDPAEGAAGISTAPTLSWEGSVGTDTYEYCLDTSDNDTCDSAWISVTTGVVTTGVSVTLSSLDSATTYSWQVRASNSAGVAYADESAWWHFTTQVAPPAAFGKTGPADGAAGISTAPTLSWEGSIGADTYQYCLDTSDNDTCDSAWISVTTGVSVTLSSLDNATTYFWQVRASNSAGVVYADESAWWYFTTQVAPPAAFGKTDPADDAVAVSLNPTLSWEESAGASGYEYCYDTSDNGICDTTWISSSTNISVTLSGLNPGITYSWQVRAINAGGMTYASNDTWWHFRSAWLLDLPLIIR